MNIRHLPLVLASLLLSACATVVVGGGSGDEESTGGQAGQAGQAGSTDQGGGGVGGEEGGSSGGQDLAAVALTRAQLDVLWEEYWSTHDPSGGATSGGTDNLDPNDLFLRLSDLGVSCDSPTTDLTCGGHYQLMIGVPPALQQPGVYDLESFELEQYSLMSETGSLNSNNPQDCPWGGGSIGAGTLEIISVDSTSVHFKVTMSNGIWETDPSGEYTAPRCQ